MKVLDRFYQTGSDGSYYLWGTDEGPSHFGFDVGENPDNSQYNVWKRDEFDCAEDMLKEWEEKKNEGVE